MEMTNELLSYEVPQVKVIEVEVEKGFAGSKPDGEIDPWS
jgi:hypothetical protein